MFAGLGIMILLVPINGVIMAKAQTLQKQMMEQKDSRIKMITEILNGIKVG